MSEDPRTARLLRETAAKPRQSIVWPVHHGEWPGNILDAFERGAQVLAGKGRRAQADWLRRLARYPGEAVGIILETGEWPPRAAEALLEAADALMSEGSENAAADT